MGFSSYFLVKDGKIATYFKIGTLSIPRRQWQRQRECGKTKGLMSRTMTLHMHYKTLYISHPFSAKQQSEITMFCVLKTTRVPTRVFMFLLENDACLHIFSLR